MAKKPKTDSATVARNRKAWHDYFIEEEFESGIALQGWEVKCLREGRAQLFLTGAYFSPLNNAASVNPDPVRDRKLLLHRRQISHLTGSVERQGYTLVPLSLYWKKGRAKLKIALAKGKRQYDKRAAIREREWNREQHRLLKSTR